MSHTHKIIIIVLFFVAIFFRVWRLDSVPPSVSLDEASIGYNAFSILQTGMDEYKTKWPIVLRAYDDWRPGLYVYLVLASIPLFGLTSLAVRFPSVVLSLLTIIFTFQATRLLSRKVAKSDTPALWTLGFMAISPWHIYISRLGHEVNLGLTLFTAGAYALCHFFMTRNIHGLYWAAVLLSLSLYGYQSEKAVVPFFLGICILFHWKSFIDARKHSVKSLLLFSVCVFYAIVLTISPEGITRLRGASAISVDAHEMSQARIAHASAVARGDKVRGIMTSRYVTAAQIIIRNYTSHFSPFWLFTGAQRESHKVPYTGLLFWWQGILLVIGAWYVWKKLPIGMTGVILAWIMTAPVPAAITTQAPHAMRIFTMVPPLMILLGFGAYALSHVRSRWLVVVGITALCIMSTWSLSKNYFTVFPQEQSDSFQYAIHPAMVYAVKNNDKYDRIIFSNQRSLYQSYMFFLFYTSYDPGEYLAQGGILSGGYEAAHQIGKFSFGFLPQRVDELIDRTLYLYDIEHVPAGSDVIARFANLDGTPVIVAVIK